MELDDGKISSTGDDQGKDISIRIPEEDFYMNIGFSRGKNLPRVPIQLRVRNPHRQYVYDPMIVSIGPYHHGKPHLRQMEEFKRRALARFLSGSDRDKGFFYSVVLERIDDIRSCYVGVTVEDYDDATLSEMILHDACFVICVMKAGTDDEESALYLLHEIGLAAGVLAEPELLMLENQIPYWVIKLLLFSRFGADEGESLLRKYMNDVCFSDIDKMDTISWEEDDEPLHLPEAIHMTLGRNDQELTNPTKPSKMILKLFSRKKIAEEEEIKTANSHLLSRQFHSVTYLKSKGIHFAPSSDCLQDIRFKSHAFHGQLLLPVRIINPGDKIILSNAIAYEMSAGVVSNLVVTSYVNFMKRLIESPKDVKELREKGVLFSNLASDEEVVELFQEIDTMGFGHDMFDKVKMRIKEHCLNKSKTWVAELLSSYLRSPWTIMAMLGAVFLLVLTFLQTYYTVRSA